jgi:hypothetical protein
VTAGGLLVWLHRRPLAGGQHARGA